MRKLLLLTICLLCSLLSPSTIFAQSVASGSAHVTATVADNAPPTTPILIAPGNNTYVTISQPSFVWEGSTDANGISKYELHLDGGLKYANIPTAATETSEYILTYDSLTNRYTLYPKSPISDGVHTWKIRVLDGLNNSTDSATWTFTMDTQSPSFVLTQIGDATVSISAQDISTIPTSPVELEENEPLLVATGEGSSTVQVTLTIPGDPTQNYSTSISSGGSWSLQLGILPREVVMTLSFTITDLAGNVSVLSGVEFVINQDVIIFPPTPTPTPTATPSPTPELSPTPLPSGVIEPTPTPTPEPTPTPAAPLIVIPVTPPREIIYEGVQELGELLPDVIINVVTSIPEPIRRVVTDTAETIAPISAALLTAAVPAATAVAVASQFGFGLSPTILFRILQALGLIPSGKPQGMVFNSQTFAPVPFALLTIQNQTSTAPSLIETVVTDVYGIYRGVKLPPDTYRITVSHQDFRFPTTKPRPKYMEMRDFYTGEAFTVGSAQQEQLFLIPVDPISQLGQFSFKSRFSVAMARLARITSALMLPLFVVSGVLAILFPSIWNWAVFGLYAFLLLQKATHWFKVPTVSGVVIDSQGQPLPQTIIRIAQPETNQLVAVLSTNDKGEFQSFIPKDIYQISAVREGYIWWDDEASTLSFHQVDASLAAQNVVITLKASQDVYQELFS